MSTASSMEERKLSEEERREAARVSAAKGVYRPRAADTTACSPLHLHSRGQQIVHGRLHAEE